MLKRFRELMASSERRLLFGSEPRGPIGVVALCVWFAFLVFPLANAIGHREPALPHALSIAAAAGFVASFGAMVVAFRTRRRGRWVLLAYWTAVLLAIALTLFDRPGWGFLFTYCSAGAVMIPSARFTLFSLAGLTALAAGASSLGGADGGTAAGFAASTAGIGLLMVLVRDLRVRNDELSSARAELARLAVAEERERFARDLHDLLGHSLSVIALKAELAGRLVGSRPSEASREIGEVERVAREALVEVREAVSGYRQPTLAAELAGARVALAAAGIAADVDAPRLALDGTVEGVLAWAVREGATNVIRHSGASRCTVRVEVGLREASVEVADDGRGVGGGGRLPSGSGGSGGHGVEGLRERAAALGGSVEAGGRPEGGFRLRVSVPVGGPAPAGSGSGSNGGGGAAPSASPVARP